MGVRERVFGILAGDGELNALGISTANLWLNSAGDSAPSERFAVVRWGLNSPGLKRTATRQEVSLWVYDTDRDYSWINSVIKRWCVLLETLSGGGTDAGWILDTEWQGEGEDGFDDIYVRITRASSYILVMTGN